MKSRFTKILASVIFASTISQFSNAQDENIEVTPIQNVTQQELAAIFVLSEVCPSYVSDQDKLKNGYSKLAKEYLPSEKNPVEALNKLAKDSKFQPILNEARADVKQAGDKKNQEVCDDVSNY